MKSLAKDIGKQRIRWHYYRIFLGGVGLFLMEAGTLFARLRYPQAGQPPERPPRLMVNKGDRFRLITHYQGSINILTEAVHVSQPPRLIVTEEVILRRPSPLSY
jgi:hypothetical protein